MTIKERKQLIDVIANYNIELEAISEESFIDTAEKVEKIREFIENL
ncbi:hypothetical protein HXA77_07295 [Listeria monocytogenes]|nr:hypothetical protein [Listeria monocytogenes]